MRQTFVFAVAGILSLLMSNSILAQQGKEEAKTEGAGGSLEDQLKKNDQDRAQEIESLQGSRCPESPLAGTASEWNGWGAAETNQRFQSNPGFTTSQVARLRLKWAFGFPNDTLAYAQPTLVWGRVFVGSAGGFVYSLNPNNGCTYWKFRAEAGVRTAVSVVKLSPGGKRLVFFADQQANVYAVDAVTGVKVWSTKVESYPGAVVTGAPLLTRGRLFVPVSSLEEFLSYSAAYECCRFRGSVIALDPSTGQQIWKTYTIDQTAHAIGHTPSGAQKWGPSGAGIWSSPTYDEKSDRLYIGTGDSYSEPAAPTSDSVLAIDAKTGAIQWVRQLTAGDIYTTGCAATPRVNCPDPAGPDFDIGSSPILVSLPTGKHVLIVGQKSGIVYGLDPDQKGLVLWQTRVGEGGHLGGVQWGSASDGKNVYVATSDRRFVLPSDPAHLTLNPTKGGGIRAISVENGQIIWEAKPQNVCNDRTNCSPAQSAAVSAMDGVVFSGSLDGHLRAYDARNGTILWDFDTARPFTTINKVEAQGGSIDAAGSVIADGMLFVTSGYGKFGGAPGNALLAFSVDGK